MNLNWESVQSHANSDGEYLLNARFWDTTLCIGIGDESVQLTISDGKLTGVEPGSEGDLSISASEEGWTEMLAKTPRPFYQDLFPAIVYHGFQVTGDTMSYFAYYPAVRRLVELMREVYNHE